MDDDSRLQIICPASTEVCSFHPLTSRHFADSQTPDRAAKPEGTRFCENRARVGGNRPTDPETLEPLTLETRAPYRADFDPGEEGKTARLALRWIGTRGDQGPWSPIYSAVIPG